MQVLSAGLGPADVELLRLACTRNRMRLRVIADDEVVTPDSDLLAVFTAAGAPAPVTAARVREHGAYPIQVQGGVSPTGVLDAVRAGYSFVFATPLQADRITSFLAYLRDVVTPPGAQVLVLDSAGGLSAPGGTVALEPAEEGALRLFGERRHRIVAREELRDAAGGADPLQVTRALRLRFEELGSGAQILTVPHMGFRFVGTVRTTAG